MPIVLYRVDERLIHGQVVVGWGTRLDVDRYLVVDDGLAGSDWEKELYVLGLPDGADAEFATVESARRLLEEWKRSPRRSILLTRDVQSILDLARGGGLRGERVNLGGLHHTPGRERVLPYLYLDAEDRERLRVLEEEEGVTVSARDLPGSSRVELERILS